MTDQVHFEVFGNLGKITLNRPKALNALTTEMCKAMIKIMQAWENDPRIGAVLVEGAGERAFCAGGDIIMLHDSAKAGDGRAEAFWRTEYALNELIYRYKKPYIALIDGIVMGGGVGLSVHGRLRVAGDNTLFAMPETGIGYFPDVGGTYFLPRLGLALGNWLGLTGARLKTEQTCKFGIANAYIPTKNHQAFIYALSAAKLDGHDSSVLDVVTKFIRQPEQAEELDAGIGCFQKDTLAEIISDLNSYGSEWAIKQLSLLNSKSPLALCITFEAMRQGNYLNFRKAMRQELNLSLNFLKIEDFLEGIRAAVIDKDRNPKWTSTSIDDVNFIDIRNAFAPSPEELNFIE